MLMYTSCGWFFDEISGIETVQVIQYAGRAIQLARDFWDDDLEAEFLEALSKAKSNLPEHGDGKQIYEKWVKPATVTLDKVAAHYGISSLFKAHENPEQRLLLHRLTPKTTATSRREGPSWRWPASTCRRRSPGNPPASSSAPCTWAITT